MSWRLCQILVMIKCLIAPRSAELLSRMCVYFSGVTEIESSQHGRQLVSGIIRQLPLQLPFMLPLFSARGKWSGVCWRCTNHILAWWWIMITITRLYMYEYMWLWDPIGACLRNNSKPWNKSDPTMIVINMVITKIMIMKIIRIIINQLINWLNNNTN